MRRISGALILILAAGPTMAQSGTGLVRVTMIRTGWNAESFAVVTEGPVINPAGCPSPDGYIAFQANRGYRTYYDAALLAFQTNARVQVVVSNQGGDCPAGRPRIIGINVMR
jgi:hypothetical protein